MNFNRDSLQLPTGSNESLLHKHINITQKAKKYSLKGKAIQTKSHSNSNFGVYNINRGLLFWKNSENVHTKIKINVQPLQRVAAYHFDKSVNSPNHKRKTLVKYVCDSDVDELIKVVSVRRGKSYETCKLHDWKQ